MMRWRQCQMAEVRKSLSEYILDELALFWRCRDAIMALHNASIKTAESTQWRIGLTRPDSRFVRCGGAVVAHG